MLSNSSFPLTNRQHGKSITVCKSDRQQQRRKSFRILPFLTDKKKKVNKTSPISEKGLLKFFNIKITFSAKLRPSVCILHLFIYRLGLMQCLHTDLLLGYVIQQISIHRAGDVTVIDLCSHQALLFQTHPFGLEALLFRR